MDPITIIFDSNTGSYESNPWAPTAFSRLRYTGSPKTLQVHLETLDLAKINDFMVTHSSYFIIGYLGYDLGRQLLAKPFSKNPELLSLPNAFLVAIEKEEIIFDEKKPITDSEKKIPLHRFRSLVPKTEYIKNVEAIKKHIQLGNIYELNYCIPFVSENVVIDPFLIFERVNQISPMPFSAFIDHPDFAIISASPERFIKRKNNRLFVQPMKGTRPRGSNETEDKKLTEELQNDQKERSENVMIVDLTRNDLSKVAKPGTVQVDELFGVYSYPSVHQMISTISCEVENNIPFAEILTATFPMGSMTGAPKSRAVDLIDEFESFSRGPYSGMMGYMDPDGDFDFNVLIRTIFYDKTRKKIFVAVGSAITSGSDVEKEYEECLIKLQPLLNSLNAVVE